MESSPTTYGVELEEEVKYVVNEDLEDWNWMRSTFIEDTGAVNSTEQGDSYFDDGIGYEVDYSCSYECQPVTSQGATTSDHGHRRVRSVSGARTNFFSKDEIGSSKSSEKDDYAEVKTVKTKTKKEKKKGVRGQFDHLQEPSLDAHFDHGYGASHETPGSARSQSINIVSSWLRDASLEEPVQDTENSRHSHGPPSRRPPPRCHPPGADMVACTNTLRPSSFPSTGHYDHHETYTEDAQYHNDPPGYQYYPDVRYDDSHLAIYNPPPNYGLGVNFRPDQKPLDKAIKLMKGGAVGFANVSKTAAVGLKTKTIEFKNLALPVMKPIFDAVLEESKEQLLGPPIRGGRGRASPFQRPNSGRGRAAMPRPMQGQLVMGRRMEAGPRPVMRPGIPAGQPMAPRRPGVLLQGGVSPLAVSADRGQGVAVRGQPRPTGGFSSRGRPRPVLAPHAPGPAP